MDPPAHLPRTVEEVEEWSVYADALMTRGDPLGEQLAFELALPEHPTRDQIAAFHSACRRLPRSRLAEGTWCLRHLRTLHVGAHHPKMSRRMGAPAAAFEAALRLVTAPSGRLLEELDVAVGTEPLDGHRRLFHALPPTCTRVTLDFMWQTALDRVDEVIALLPPQVREVALGREPHGGQTPHLAARMLRDRFDVVDVSNVWLEASALGGLLSALERTSSVSLATCVAHGPLQPRQQLGRPGDAAFMTAERCVVVPRWPLGRLQARYGLIPARTQLAWLPEYDTYDAGLRPAVAGERGLELTRRGDAWTIRYEKPLWIDDEPIAPQRIAPLPDGARLRLGDRPPFTFAATEIAARFGAP